MENQSSFPFFSFRNAETAEAIKAAISQTEGVLFKNNEEFEKYLVLSQAKARGRQLGELTKLLKQFGYDNRMSTGELIGTANLALQEIRDGQIRLGNQYIQEIKRRQEEHNKLVKKMKKKGEKNGT